MEGLRERKLSWRKAEYVWDIASKEAAGEIDLEGLFDRSDEDVVATLTQLRGVGVWTAHWLLVRTLGRTDGFPHGDLAIQRTLGDVVNGGARMTGEEALAYSLRWSPYRTYVTTYLFAAIRSGAAGVAAAVAVRGAPFDRLRANGGAWSFWIPASAGMTVGGGRGRRVRHSFGIRAWTSVAAAEIVLHSFCRGRGAV